MYNSTLLFIGGSSRIGQVIVRDLMALGYSVCPTRHASHVHNECIRMDITNPFEIELVLATVKPSYVINFAAFADVFECERQPQNAAKINVEGARNVARLCARTQLPLIHISSDYVFPGKSGPYKVTDAPEPINVYGHTKLLGEIACREELKNVSILRLSHVYNPSSSTIGTGMLEIKKSCGKAVEIPNDIYTTPTDVHSIAPFLQRLIESPVSLAHYSGGVFMSWFELSCHLARRFGFDTDRILPISAFDWTGPGGIKVSWPLRGGII